MRESRAALPDNIRAVIDALRFNGRGFERLCAVREEEWPALLDWCDQRQLTLLLHSVCAADLPESVRERMNASRDRCARRFSNLLSDLDEIASALERRDIPFVVLKGITHSPTFTPDPLLRAQGDIDLWFPASEIENAQSVLLGLGYQPRRAAHGDGRHLPPMARPNDWRWRGDVFDPEMPIHVEAHFTLWSDGAEYIVAPGQTDFWNRRVTRDFDERPLPVLSPPDLLGFAALHFLLHLLHGDLPLQRAWEIASFLHSNVDNDVFWNRWRQLHHPALRRLEALVFAITQVWFRCDVHAVAQQHIDTLARDVKLWLRHFVFSPLRRYGAPNKDELWLHLALVSSASGRLRVLLRRLFPPVLARKGGLSTSRLAHHWRTFTPTLMTGLRWLWLKHQEHRSEPLPASLP